MRRVAIVGLGPSHDQVPWREWETWGLPWDAWFPRYDLGFEMHDRSLWNHKTQYLKRLRESDVPIMMREAHKDIPASLKYPDVGQNYFGSSPAYMLAYAIHQGVDEIGLWGVDLNEDIYDHQRPNLEYLIGFANGRGIQVQVPKGSRLLSHKQEDLYDDRPVIYPKRYGEVEWPSVILAI